MFNNDTKYEYGCAMLYFEFDELGSIQREIEPEDVYVGNDDLHGIAKNPHVTLLSGSHKCNASTDIVHTIENFKLSELVLHNISSFATYAMRGEFPFEVLKFDVGSTCLHQINAQLREIYSNTCLFPYHPHSTIAFLKPGAAQKYLDMFKGFSYIAVPTKIVYCNPNGEKATLLLDKDKNNTKKWRSRPRYATL